MLTADDPPDTATAWLFVAVQFALLAAVLLLPAGDDWTLASWADRSALAAQITPQIAGVIVLVVGLVNLGRSLTPLPTPVLHGELRVEGMYRWVRHPIHRAIMLPAVGAACAPRAWPPRLSPSC